jgi:8-oxo-dGTP pyrophosphatase MutT (NUDIX family)
LTAGQAGRAEEPGLGDRIRLVALQTYGTLPAWARKFLIRRISPSFRVGAACIVVRDDGAILLVRHSYRGGWGLPGGLIRRGEEPEHAALRESREEVGLDLELEGAPRTTVHVAGRRIDVIFQARISPNPTRQEPVARYPEIVEVRWFDPAELPPLQEEAADALSEKCGANDAAGGPEDPPRTRR